MASGGEKAFAAWLNSRQIPEDQYALLAAEAREALKNEFRAEVADGTFPLGGSAYKTPGTAASLKQAEEAIANFERGLPKAKPILPGSLQPDGQATAAAEVSRTSAAGTFAEGLDTESEEETTLSETVSAPAPDDFSFIPAPAKVGPEFEFESAAPRPRDAQGAQAPAAAEESWARYVNGFVKAGKETVASIQKQLLDGGYLEEGKFDEGDADYPTLQALKLAAYEAKVRGIPLTQRLKEKALLHKDTTEEDKAKTFQEQQLDAYKRSIAAKHFELWGLPAPPGHAEAIVSAGMNLFQYEYEQRQQPAFTSSPKYQAERIGLNEQLARELGSLG